MKAETEKVPEKPESNPLKSSTWHVFNQYLGSGGEAGVAENAKSSERPHLKSFCLRRRATEHLTWQLSVTVCIEEVREMVGSNYRQPR